MEERVCLTVDYITDELERTRVKVGTVNKLPY